jgi:DNA invertase Pin-like site-specific DNA recombinase
LLLVRLSSHSFGAVIGQSCRRPARACSSSRVPRFREKISGARSDRKQLARLVNSLTKGDVVIVTRLDRLARSTRDLLNLLASIAEKGAGFKSLGDAWADRTTAHGRLMLTVLGGLAEFERELIRSRTGEGRARAVARGVKLGRKPKLTGHQRKEAIAVGRLARCSPTSLGLILIT